MTLPVLISGVSSVIVQIRIAISSCSRVVIPVMFGLTMDCALHVMQVTLKCFMCIDLLIGRVYNPCMNWR